jgi:hypothetical protein
MSKFPALLNIEILMCSERIAVQEALAIATLVAFNKS